MIEVTIKADTIAELHDKLRNFIMELVPQVEAVPQKIDEDPVENSAPVQAAARDPEAHREELRALCVEISAKHEGRTSVIVDALMRVAAVRHVRDVPDHKLDAVEAALRELL
jgi:hypothetical protein